MIWSFKAMGMAACIFLACVWEEWYGGEPAARRHVEFGGMLETCEQLHSGQKVSKRCADILLYPGCPAGSGFLTSKKAGMMGKGKGRTRSRIEQI